MVDTSEQMLIGCIIFTVLNCCVCCFWGCIQHTLISCTDAWTGEIGEDTISKYACAQICLQLPLIGSIVGMWLCYVYLSNLTIFWIIAVVPLVIICILSSLLAKWFDDNYD